MSSAEPIEVENVLDSSASVGDFPHDKDKRAKRLGRMVVLDVNVVACSR